MIYFVSEQRRTKQRGSEIRHSTIVNTLVDHCSQNRALELTFSLGLGSNQRDVIETARRKIKDTTLKDYVTSIGPSYNLAVPS